MIKKRRKITLILVIIIAVSVFWFLNKGSEQESEGKSLVSPSKKDLLITVVTTGVVEPQNRLELKPSISGRIEEMLVEEGDKIEKGDILAWMSSTERAALIDAARSQDEETLKYWEEVYKKTPIISPITGEVIVRSVVPGQTVTTSEAVLVLSDRLIINAQFDETDIGRVKVGQESLITLDAYPDVRIKGVVDHIAYESEVVNNVTIYEVDIVPEDIPDILRSGMSVSVEAIEGTSDRALTVPSEAIHYDNGDIFVLIRNGSGKPVRRDITIGLNNGESVEIISGLSLDDKVLVNNNFSLPKRKSVGSSPFMPNRKNK